MQFIFLRHGNYHQPKGVPSALLPYSLNDEGIAQSTKAAKELLEYFKQNQQHLPKVIHTSSALRAYQTAKIIKDYLNKHLGCKIYLVETAELTERKLGAMANLTVEQIESIVSKDPRYSNLPEGWKSSRYFCLPYVDCESLEMAGKRVKSYIEANLEQDANTIFVGHGASFRNACVDFNLLKEDELTKLSMHHATPLHFIKTKEKWILQKGEWKIREQKEKLD